LSNHFANISDVIGNTQANLLHGVRGYWQRFEKFALHRESHIVIRLPMPHDQFPEGVDYFQVHFSIGIE
jgi:hypothetical protein